MSSTGRGILPIGSVGIVIGVGVAIHTAFLKRNLKHHSAVATAPEVFWPRAVPAWRGVGIAELSGRKIRPLAGASPGRAQGPAGSLAYPDWSAHPPGMELSIRFTQLPCKPETIPGADCGPPEAELG